MIVTGKNVRVLIYDNGGFRLYACATTCSINLATSSVETSTTGSGLFSTFEPQKHSWTASLEGAINLDKPGQLTLADLRAKQIAMAKFLINYERQDDNGNVYTDSGTAFTTNSSDTGGVNDLATFSIELQGTGPLTQIFTPTTLALSAVRRYPTTGNVAAAAGGETTITIASLIGKDILSVVRDGVGYDIITSGTPVNKEVLYISATGEFTWMTAFEPGETYYINYQDI